MILDKEEIEQVEGAEGQDWLYCSISQKQVRTFQGGVIRTLSGERFVCCSDQDCIENVIELALDSHFCMAYWLQEKDHPDSLEEKKQEWLELCEKVFWRVNCERIASEKAGK